MSTEDNKALVQRTYEGFNQGNLAVFTTAFFVVSLGKPLSEAAKPQNESPSSHHYLPHLPKFGTTLYTITRTPSHRVPHPQHLSLVGF